MIIDFVLVQNLQLLANKGIDNFFYRTPGTSGLDCIARINIIVSQIIISRNSGNYQIKNQIYLVRVFLSMAIRLLNPIICKRGANPS